MAFPSPFYRWRPHPWHGLEIGNDPRREINAYIELTPFDLVKYEIDKMTGYLRVDRPQRTSSVPPALYGFIPRTFCGSRVCDLMPGTEAGDGDPLDICVLSERPISRGEIIVSARIVGGLPMNDGGEADDKLIAVLVNDPIWQDIGDVTELPQVLVERLRHYFATYKMIPGQVSGVSIGGTYGREHALNVLAAAIADYEEEYGTA
ncbi:MAG: inorganic pyrophosphatase [Verrucomicrobiales bacterium]